MYCHLGIQTGVLRGKIRCDNRLLDLLSQNEQLHALKVSQQLSYVSRNVEATDRNAGNGGSGCEIM